MKFRFHRGGFEASMATMTEVSSMAELQTIIQTEYAERMAMPTKFLIAPPAGGEFDKDRSATRSKIQQRSSSGYREVSSLDWMGVSGQADAQIASTFHASSFNPDTITPSNTYTLSSLNSGD